MKTITGIAWFVNQRGTVGIVTTVDELGIRHGYISSVFGMDEEADKVFIARWGAKINYPLAEDIVREHGIKQNIKYTL
jgi:hypothetical protein